METINVWGETLVTMMTTLWGKVAGFLPNLLAAVVLVVAGYYLARLLGFVVSRGLARIGLDSLSQHVGIAPTLERAGIKLQASEILGRIVFWIVALLFLITATETLGLPRVSETLDEFLLYLPRVLGAALIVIVGLYIAHFVRDLVRSGAEGLGVDYARPLGATAYGVLFIVVVSLAIGQLDVDTLLLDSIVAILIAAIGIAAALSLGLGTRDLSTNILAGVYARDLYAVGDKIELGDIAGTLESIGTVKTQIRLADEKVVSIANRAMISGRVTVQRQ